MTSVTFLNGSHGLSGYVVTGHSTKDENDLEGRLCCAAVSSAAFMAANTLSEILHLPLDASAEDGFMQIKVLEKTEQAQPVLQGFLLHAKELAQQYPGRIKVKIETAGRPASCLEESVC